MTSKVKTRVISKEVMAVIEEILSALKMNPQEEITHHLGSGSHARHLNDNGKAPQVTDKGSKKIIIAGDSYDMAINELYYALWDLAVDLHISDEKRELLREIS